MSSKVRWGILGCGIIATAFARGLAHSVSGALTAVGSRHQESADLFGKKFGLEGDFCHSSYEALLANANVDAVYIATPHPSHAEWAIKAAEAGKHIFCTKPLAMNHAEASAIVEAARRNGVFLQEAFLYRCHPQTRRLTELIREGAIGRVRLIQAAYGFNGPDDPRSRLLDPQLGGGGILDVGCYPVSMCRLIAGAAMGGNFAEPVELHGSAHIGETGVDLCAVATAKFPGNILAQISTAVKLNQENVVRIFGDQGHIFVPAPWDPSRDGGSSRIFLHRHGESAPQEIVFEAPEKAESFLFASAAEHVASCLQDDESPATESPAMSWADSLGNMQMLDRWRAAVGLTYPIEETRSHPKRIG
jgi:predicted dehydrogenase